MKKIGIIAVVLSLFIAGLALAGGNITTVYVKTASTTTPTQNTDGTPLNTLGTANGVSDPGQPVTRAQVTLFGTGEIVAGRLLMWRFVRDAGWARDPSNDIVIPDAGINLGTGINGGSVTLAPITYLVNGNTSRIDATVSGLLQTDAGVGLASIRIETTWH